MFDIHNKLIVFTYLFLRYRLSRSVDEKYIIIDMNLVLASDMDDIEERKEMLQGYKVKQRLCGSSAIPATSPRGPHNSLVYRGSKINTPYIVKVPT